MFTDTHTHLYLPEFDADREALIEKAMADGINKFFLPNIDSTSVESLLALEERYPTACRAMMGLHPCSVNENYNKELESVEHYLKQRRFAAIGEIGIDLYWDKTFLAQQQIVFRTQVEWALQYDYPIVIHCREAFNEIYDLLASFQKLPKGIFHCFSGTLEEAEKIIALTHFKLGIGGVLTFKNSGLDKVIKDVAIEHLVLETDAPYLAPAPHRGKRNEPAYLLEVAIKLSQLKQVSLDEVARITTANAAFIFE